MNQKLKIIIPLILVLAAFGIFFFTRKPKDTGQDQIPQRKIEEINKLPVKDRPFVTLTPRADGREVTLTVDKVKNATTIEYELEYQAESLIQGVFGTIDLTKESQPVAKDLLFGSCSKGKCRYDEGVSGGSLTMRFEGAGEAYVLKSDFNLQLAGDREGEFTSKDAKATLNVGRSGLPLTTYVIVAGTMGLPAEVEGEVVAGPYAFLAPTAQKLSAAELGIKSKEDLTGARIMFWNGSSWVELDATIGEGTISAPATALGTFIVVK